ncbi:MAG: GNAT family N-acetyltransferase, partial [Clostridia bacterium]|nr:GNAT family N-acetyltransferase [Clostridia bacterium]
MAYARQGIATARMKTAHAIAGGEKDIAVYLIANNRAVPFYEKLGMKKTDDVMEYNHIEWTAFTVESCGFRFLSREGGGASLP